MKRALHIALASALVTTAAFPAAPALAAEPATSLRHVRTADLDLGSEAGRRKLDQRLANAARELCGTASNLDVEGRNLVRRCRSETLARARAGRVAATGTGGTLAVAANR